MHAYKLVLRGEYLTFYLQVRDNRVWCPIPDWFSSWKERVLTYKSSCSIMFKLYTTDRPCTCVVGG